MFDIFCKIDAPSRKTVADIITNDIRKIPQIHHTETIETIPEQGGVMPIAYVLINCRSADTKPIMYEIRTFYGVAEVQGIAGDYNILAKITATSSHEVNRIITAKVRKIAQIQSTVTLLGTD